MTSTTVAERAAAIEQARTALINALGEEGTPGYFAHLSRLAHNLDAMEQAVDQWGRVGDAMHAQARTGFTNLIDPDDGDATLNFLPEKLRQDAGFHARALRDTAYTIAGHYRRELHELNTGHEEMFGPSWREVLALAIELHRARTTAEAAGDPPTTLDDLDGDIEDDTVGDVEPDGEGGIRWVDQ